MVIKHNLLCFFYDCFIYFNSDSMKQINKTLLIAIIALTLLGLLMIYSSSNVWALYKFNDAYKYLKSQLLFLIIGYFIMLLVAKIPTTIYKKYANHILTICLILLVLVLIPGIGTIRNGSRSWFGIGPLGIQPSEAAKLGLIIFTSKYLTNNKIKDIKTSVLPILLTMMVVFGLIMLQPDLGTGVIIVMSVVALLFVSGVNMSFFIKLGILGILGIVILVIIAPYRMARITSFINPWSDPLGSGFQIIQSLYAIGPGGLLGMGLGKSIQKHFYLPEPQTDFIFAIISEELGFMGVVIVATLFLIIIYCGFKIALNCEDKFRKYLAYGIAFSVAFQTVLNLMVVVGLIPVTGVTLPFLSYGGSSLLVSMIEMGFLLNIGANN